MEAKGLRAQIRKLVESGHEQNLVFMCSPLSRPLQTLVAALLPVLEELGMHNITVQIHPGLRERHMQGDSSVINFLYGLKLDAQEKVDMLNWRHIFALDQPYFTGWDKFIKLDYTHMRSAFDEKWDDNYTKRKIDYTKGKVEPRPLFEHNVIKFILHERSLAEDKIIIAACHGGTCRFILNKLGIKANKGERGHKLTGLVHVDRFHINNVDAFCLKKKKGASRTSRNGWDWT